jgi:putative nucleotidyltransferase with HDIG domain
MQQDGARRPISLKLLLSLTTAAVAVVAVIAATAVLEHNERRVLQVELQSRLALEARNLALLSTDALLTDFPELVLVPLVHDLVERNDELAIAVVVDGRGLVRGHSDARQVGARYESATDLRPVDGGGRLLPDEQLLGDDETIAMRVPIRYRNGQVLGWVVAGQRRDLVDELLAETQRHIGLMAAALAAIGALAAALLMSRLLRPLDAIREGLARIGRGDLERPIGLSSRTELGLLSGTVDTMASHLRASRAEAKAKELEIVDTQRELIATLNHVAEGRSHETSAHTVRVGHMAALLARLAGLDEASVELLRMAAPMHDIGKIGIPDAILNKPGVYDGDERAAMKRHAALGYEMLRHSDRPLLKAAAIVAHQHHEWWDGRGYPQGLRGEEIHIYGRIVAIVDVFDALTCKRVYREPLPWAQALGVLRNGVGEQFDPRLLEIFLANVPEFQALAEAQCDWTPSPRGRDAEEFLATVMRDELEPAPST